MAKNPEVIRVATVGRDLRNRIPRSRPRKKDSSIRGTMMAAAKTPPNAFHGTAFFRRKILLVIKTTAPTRRGMAASKMPATTSRRACRFLSNCRSRKEWSRSERRSGQRNTIAQMSSARWKKLSKSNFAKKPEKRWAVQKSGGARRVPPSTTAKK